MIIDYFSLPFFTGLEIKFVLLLFIKTAPKKRWIQIFPQAADVKANAKYSAENFNCFDDSPLQINTLTPYFEILALNVAHNKEHLL